MVVWIWEMVSCIWMRRVGRSSLSMMTTDGGEAKDADEEEGGWVVGEEVDVMMVGL